MANIYGLLVMAAPIMFPIDMPIDYEPDPARNMGALAAEAGQDIAAFMYDYLTAGSGEKFAIVLGGHYSHATFDVLEEMLRHPHTTIGLSDCRCPM